MNKEVLIFWISNKRQKLLVINTNLKVCNVELYYKKSIHRENLDFWLRILHFYRIFDKPMHKIAPTLRMYYSFSTHTHFRISIIEVRRPFKHNVAQIEVRCLRLHTQTASIPTPMAANKSRQSSGEQLSAGNHPLLLIHVYCSGHQHLAKCVYTRGVLTNFLFRAPNFNWNCVTSTMSRFSFGMQKELRYGV